MLRDDVVNLVAGRLVRSDQNANIILEMQLLQSTILEGGDFLPWFLRKDDPTSLVATAFQETVALPPDFIRMQEKGLFRKDPNIPVATQTPWVSIVRDLDYGHMINRAGGSGQGAPNYYNQQDDIQFYLAPIPDAAITYQLRIRYFAKDIVLSTNIENKWTKWAPDYVAAVTAFHVAQKYVRNMELATAIGPEIAVARRRLLVQDEARQNADQIYAMGDT